jgi:phosphatidylserine/phosphatidylglycerophosphate/cardiolipin synthase-like enzyme
MRALSIAVVAFGTMVSAPAFAQSAGSPILTTCFTPGQNCEAMIVSQIDRAKSELLIQSYKFTNRAVVRAMERAQDRGVKVRLILDDSLEKRNTKTFQKMRDSGIDLRLDDAVKTAHNKVIVVDHSTVITGSFNFTESAADKNAENIIIVEGSPKVADEYARNWEKRYAASRPPLAEGAAPKDKPTKTKKD